jgi:multicomponent Na+:H+ antiporter subunit D
MESRIAQVEEQRPIVVAAGFITIGLALKIAIFPLHIWLPNAYANAPHLVTAFVAACSTKIALYVLLRFDFFVFQGNLAAHAMQFSSFLAPLAVLGILVGSAVAIGEGNVKRMLAYSSIAQLGYILLGASFNDIGGMTAAITLMFNHGLAKGALFLAVAAIAMHAPRLDTADLAGAGRRMPWTVGALIVAGASLVGVPGTAGFISKWLLLTAALQQGALGVAAVLVIVLGSLAALVYVWRLIEPACFGQAAAEDAGVEHTEAPWTLLLALWLAAFANLYFGLVPQLPVGLAAQAAEVLLGHLP